MLVYKLYHSSVLGGRWTEDLSCFRSGRKGRSHCQINHIHGAEGNHLLLVILLYLGKHVTVDLRDNPIQGLTVKLKGISSVLVPI